MWEDKHGCYESRALFYTKALRIHTFCSHEGKECTLEPNPLRHQGRTECPYVALGLVETKDAQLCKKLKNILCTL